MIPQNNYHSFLCHLSQNRTALDLWSLCLQRISQKFGYFCNYMYLCGVDDPALLDLQRKAFGPLCDALEFGLVYPDETFFAINERIFSDYLYICTQIQLNMRSYSPSQANYKKGVTNDRNYC